MKKIDNKNYDLYLYKTDKFKTINLRLVFASKITGKDLIYQNVLMNTLIYSSKKYPSNRDLLIVMEDLYDIYLNTSVTRCGEKLLACLDLSFINPIYTNKKYTKLSIDLLKEIIINPNITHNHFDKDVVKLIKEQLFNDIMYSYNYAQGMVNEELYGSLKNTNINITLYQNKNILEEINENSLYDYYLDFINNSNISLFICGNVDDNMLKLLSLLPLKSKRINCDDNLIVDSSDNNVHIIKGDYNQNKIAYLLKYKTNSIKEDFYNSTVFSYIYGNLQDSLLMTNVRERDSLVYYIDSYLRKYDQVIMINAGFSKTNTKKVIKGIKENLELIQKGDFNEELIDKAIKTILIDLDDMERLPISIINYMLSRVYFIDLSIKEKKDNYQKVTKKDIMKFANKIDLCKIMVLEGIKDEKEA